MGCGIHFCLPFLFQEGCGEGAGVPPPLPTSLFTHLTGASALLSLLRTRHHQPLKERRIVVPPFPPVAEAQEDVGLASVPEPAWLLGAFQDGAKCSSSCVASR